jgi:putative Mn2+ efflux pump MntP
MDDVNIWTAAAVIGVTTFTLSFIGVAIGNKIGAKFQSKAQIAGGIVLILIGIKILAEHMGWI